MANPKSPKKEDPKKPPTPGTPAPKGQQQRTAVGPHTGGELILMGDKADTSHIKTGVARGNEQVGTEDLTIPRLEVVQSQSKCLNAGSPEYIEHAKPGDLINSVSRQVYGAEVFVVPVHYAKMWLVWKSYDEGGGFFGAFPDPAGAEARLQEALGDGEKKENMEVIDTPQHLVLLVDPIRGTVEEVMLALAKTKAKVSRDWNTMIKLTGMDRFARVYRVSTAKETNKKNQTYWNFVVSQSGTPAKVLYERAEKLFEALSSGKRRVVMDVNNLHGGGEPNPEM